jgi:hypothetical protein
MEMRDIGTSTVTTPGPVVAGSHARTWQVRQENPQLNSAGPMICGHAAGLYSPADAGTSYAILTAMPELISGPTRVAAAGEPPKLIDEFVGRASTGEDSSP